MPRIYTFDVPDFDDCGGRTMRRVEVPKRTFREIEADVAAPLEAEIARLREWALKAFTIVEWAVGEGFCLEPPYYDCDDALLEGCSVLGIETASDARAALGGESND
jgi:hypothetical protein